MDEELLREYVEEVLLSELSIDRKFLNHLRQSAGLRPTLDTLTAHARSIADEWLDDVEDAIGRRLWPGKRAQVIRFVAQRLPMLVRRFHGDVKAAEQTMYNILNARFYSLRGDHT